MGKLLALPPAPLARRFGPRLTDRLYRLDGRLPDPRTALVPPPAFAERTDLPLEATSSTAGLAFSLRRLLTALSGYLRQCDLEALELELILTHHRREPTRVTLRFAAPAQDAAHLERVASERLARVTLLAPVIGVSLKMRRFGTRARETTSLLEERLRPEGPSIAELVDELGARLGLDRVRLAHVIDEHRPEAASGAGDDASPEGSAPWPARPLWLLPSPRVATERLEIVSAPERIEAGWWQEVDVRRDYFIARDVYESHYWVFRHREDGTGRVWIHGVFA